MCTHTQYYLKEFYNSVTMTTIIENTFFGEGLFNQWHKQ